mmetsp:Transcript_12474/g.29248  ORF Transcript_12474/g.29248 Transcript_12474/m.29248 type:complete len:110 (-) Transcript_12474:20-349(-)
MPRTPLLGCIKLLDEGNAALDIGENPSTVAVARVSARQRLGTIFMEDDRDKEDDMMYTNLIEGRRPVGRECCYQYCYFLQFVTSTLICRSEREVGWDLDRLTKLSTMWV